MRTSKRSWPGVFVGVFLVAAGLLGTYITAGHMVIGYIASHDWVQVPVDLRRIEFVRSHNEVGGKSAYKLDGAYVYQFDGVEYRSDRISVVFGSDNIGSYWVDLYHKIVSLYKVNEVVAYVNPHNPAQAVLDRTLRLSHIVFGLLFFTVFCGIGMAFLISSLGLRKKEAVNNAGLIRGKKPSNPVVVNNTRYVDIHGGVRRNIGSGLIGTVVGVFILAIGYLSLKDGWGPGFLFLLVGAFIVGFTLWVLMQKLAIRLEVKIDKQTRVLHIRRQWFGVFSFFSRAEVIERKQFFVKEISRGQHNGYYQLKFNAERKIYTISGWIEGRNAADRLLREILSLCFEEEIARAA